MNVRPTIMDHLAIFKWNLLLLLLMIINGQMQFPIHCSTILSPFQTDSPGIIHSYHSDGYRNAFAQTPSLIIGSSHPAILANFRANIDSNPSSITFSREPSQPSPISIKTIENFDEYIASFRDQQRNNEHQKSATTTSTTITASVKPKTTPKKPKTILLESSEQMPINLVFRSLSSRLNLIQDHQTSPKDDQKLYEMKKEEEPIKMVLNITKPIIQEVHEVILPYRNIKQEVHPVKESIETTIMEKRSDLDQERPSGENLSLSSEENPMQSDLIAMQKRQQQQEHEEDGHVPAQSESNLFYNDNNKHHEEQLMHNNELGQQLQQYVNYVRQHRQDQTAPPRRQQREQERKDANGKLMTMHPMIMNTKFDDVDDAHHFQANVNAKSMMNLNLNSNDLDGNHYYDHLHNFTPSSLLATTTIAPTAVIVTNIRRLEHGRNYVVDVGGEEQDSNDSIINTSTVISTDLINNNDGDPNNKYNVINNLVDNRINRHNRLHADSEDSNNGDNAIGGKHDQTATEQKDENNDHHQQQQQQQLPIEEKQMMENHYVEQPSSQIENNNQFDDYDEVKPMMTNQMNKSDLIYNLYSTLPTTKMMDGLNRQSSTNQTEQQNQKMINNKNKLNNNNDDDDDEKLTLMENPYYEGNPTTTTVATTATTTEDGSRNIIIPTTDPLPWSMTSEKDIKNNSHGLL